METGIYPTMEAAAYHAIQLPSNSLLSKLRRSPLQALHQMQNPTRPTPEMKFGTALHALALEPAKFAEQYVTLGRCTATKNGDGGACSNDAVGVFPGGAQLCGVHCKGLSPAVDHEALTASDGATLAAMAASLQAHPAASKLLSMPGDVEVSAVFDDPTTGVRCKMRADKIIRGGINAIVDIKTTRDACRHAFANSMGELGYFRQGALYMRGLAALGEDPIDAFIIIAIEKEPPFDLCVYRIDEESLSAGHAELDELLMTYARCMDNGVWPGYGDEIIDINLPAWRLRQRSLELKTN